jgi:acyl-CoA thioester hydrolase
LNWDTPHPHLYPVAPAPDDIDGLRHTNNAVYVKWCQQAGWSHSEKLGLDFAAWQRLDRAMAIQSATYDYLLPTSLGDELLLGTWLAACDGKLSMERRFQLVRPADGATVMRARWQLVCIEIGSGKPKRMPAEFPETYMPAVAGTGPAPGVGAGPVPEPCGI